MRIITTILAIILTCALPCAGRIHDVRFSHIGIDKGLSHATVNGISQDRFGYIWVATPDGLNRYDGYRFNTFAPDSADHFVRTVAADADRTIWAATAHTLSKYSFADGDFVNYPLPGKGTVNTILPLGSKQITVGTSRGLLIFSPETGQFRRTDGAGNENVTALAVFGGNLIMGTSTGKVYKQSGKRFVELPFRSGAEINVLMGFRGKLLIGSEGAGLLIYSPSDNSVRTIKGEQGGDYVRSLLTDSQGRLWIGTFRGLHIMDPELKEYVFHEDGTAADGALSHSSVRRMFADNQGGIWLGTYFGGLNYYHPGQNQFRTLHKTGNDRLSLSGNIAGPLAEDPNGRIWIGTNTDGLNIYNPANGEIRKITSRDGLGSDDVKAIYFEPSLHRTYVGAHTGGLTTVDLDSYRVNYLRGIAQSVYDILPSERPGHLWLATLDGLTLFDTATNSAQRVTAEGLPGLTSGLMRDPKGRLWVSGENGLAVYDEDNGHLTLCRNLPRLNYQVNDVYYSKLTGYYWISTHRGLLCYDEKKGSMSRYLINNGLPGDIIYATLQDPNGNIWATTNRGLASLNPATGEVISYNNRDGLSNTQFTERSALNATNGLMYFGGLDGVTYFNPTILEKNTYAPASLIEGVRLFNKPVRPGDSTGILDNGITEAHELVFSADQTNFTIDFTACDYVSKGENTFQYMLDGLDKGWTTAPAGVRSATYSNLPAGNYVFRLRAANNDGVWSSREATIGICILPPWYLRWWAIAVAVILAMGAGFFTVRFIWKKQIREKQEKDMREVTEMKVRFFVNMSHELRTPLTLMLLPLNEMIASHPDPATMHKLTTIRNNTLRIRHIVNQLLDYRRAELGMFRLNVSGTDINRLMQDILEPYKTLATNKHIDFRYDSTAGDNTVMVDSNYLELIVNNLVTNAFKYTPAGGRISVSLSDDDKTLTLTVSDSGCGIPADKLGTIFTRFFQVNDSNGGYGIGLSLVKRLVELHHGSITVESAVGKGSTFTVTLPADEAAYSADEKNAAEPMRAADRRNEDVEALLPMNDDTPQSTSESDNEGRKTILVVDDNAEILKYLSGAMSKDFRVLTALNGNKAIETLGADNVDLVISDVMMPDMDGVQLCRAIKRNLRTSHIPVILLSAKADVADRLSGLKVGADDYIPKPFSMDELMAKVSNLIRTRENIIRHYSNENAAIEPSKVAQNPLDEEFLNKAVKVMGEHIDDSQFTTDEFAREMCMSRSNLHMKMKALTGESTNDFIRRTRLRKASELLKSRRYTVAEVSAMVGYSTPSYFATAFKNFYGYSPSTLLSQS